MSSIEKLKQLEEAGEHLFHGSPDGTLEVLEPRQSTHTPDLSKPEETILDGEPAVSATPYADIATFRSLINGNNIPFDHSSGFGVNAKGEKNFQVSSPSVLEAIRDKKGYVYVFNKNEFKPFSRHGEIKEGNMEWRAHKPVSPVDVVEVGHEDLPPLDMIKISSIDD
jgi:hypothetical protein